MTHASEMQQQPDSAMADGEQSHSAPSVTPASDRDAIYQKYLRDQFKRRLELSRKKLGTPQNIIADFVGVTPSTYSKWESQKTDLLPSIDKVVALATFLQVSTDYLLDLETPNQNFTSDELELIALFRALRLSDKSTILTLARRFKQG